MCNINVFFVHHTKKTIENTLINESMSKKIPLISETRYICKSICEWFCDNEVYTIKKRKMIYKIPIFCQFFFDFNSLPLIKWNPIEKLIYQIIRCILSRKVSDTIQCVLIIDGPFQLSTSSIYSIYNPLSPYLFLSSRKHCRVF